jgi:aspartyl-tRNA(Asn)/glutamyl-tRNA(Gln) amidotransferase subunit B
MDAPAKKSELIKGATGDWEVVIGLEVHAQVTSQAKLFSGASTEFGGEPNSHVSLVDAAMPGMLPVINAECVRQAVRTGLGLKAKINLKSVFDRKNYFYPDLPPGYQISQYKSPIVGEGEVLVDMPDGETVRVGIERLHLEQDAGKSLHDQNPSMSLVDLNRAGVALMEIVSKPDLRSADEAMAFIAKLRSLMRHLGTCDGDMEKGSLRADVNVSVRKPGAPYNTRCEIKNVNSIRFIGQAVEYEARRQIEIIEDGGKIMQETRLFDPDKGETRSMRTKEEAHDYRYFPDPDLLPLELSQSFVEELRASLPETDEDKKARYLGYDDLTKDDVSALLTEKELREEFETWRELAPNVPPKALLNWLRNEHLRRLRKEGFTLRSSPIPAAVNVAIVELAANGVIPNRHAKALYDRIWLANTTSSSSERVSTAEDVRQFLVELGLDREEANDGLEKLVDEVIAQNPSMASEASTNPKVLPRLFGQVMKASGGKANPENTNELLKKKLFDDRKRIRQEPLKPGERLYDYYDESNRDGYAELRSFLNLWLSEIDNETHLAELISRAQNGGNNAFRGVVCEAMTHALLIRLGYKVEVHPEMPGSKRHPDFALKNKTGEILGYVEVTTVNQADEKDKESNREAAIYTAINGAKLPSGCVVGYNLVQAGSDSPALGPLVKAIEDWARENCESALTEDVVKSFPAGNWIIEIDLYSGLQGVSGSSAIGTATMAGGWITPHRDIRAALERKSRGYGNMKVPYVIVVADAKNQLFHKEATKNAITEAVFGDEQVVLVSGEQPKRGFAKNGFWHGPHGYQNRHVSGVLVIPDATIWKLREERWQPILAVHPFPNHSIPEAIGSLIRLEAIDDKWALRDGKSVADVLGLPVPWPPSEK